MSKSSKPPAKKPADVPDLRSLGPRYDEQLHGHHTDVLLKVLSDQSSTGAKNIALTGHYGSGKSSVILGVQVGLTKKKIEWVNLSLSSLGINDTKQSRVQEDGTPTPLTNLIQKELVKQLLYRKAPADMPGSRYFRIDTFRAWRAVQWAVATAFGFFAVAALLGMVNRVEKVAPTSLIDGRPWAPWLIVGTVGAFMGVVCFMTLRGLQNPVRVDSVSAGGAAVSLSAKENSYFDEYLDEIVYFFQQTKTRVAIFEDLDRFKDPHIFETLRELNTVLNNSEQVKSRPVKFVYAVRDSIFEQLEGDFEPESESLNSNPPSSRPLRVAAQESVPSANRTKFFDLVVPMVPFITHRSARDLLAAEFKDSSQQPSKELINVISGARVLTDMRLIRNIHNEFEIYRASVLGENGLKGLTEDRLFAMMVYKNTHLEDFEAIRLGTSQIDAAYRAFQEMVEHQIRHQAMLIRDSLMQLRRASSWKKRASVAGERLQQVLPVIQKATHRAGEFALQHSSGNYTLADLTSEKMWRELFESREDVQLNLPGYPVLTLSFDELLLLVGEAGQQLKANVAGDVQEIRRRSRVARDNQAFVTKATMADLMGRIDLSMPMGVDRKELCLDEIVSGIVSPLAHELLAEGYIDENFTLYCSDYHDVAISLSAMNFILHCVQADQAYPLFRFDGPASIEAVENEVGDRFLGGESVFNIDVFNHYLVKDHTRLERALDRLATRAATGDTAFLDLYLEDNSAETKDRLVSELAPLWDGLFVHLVKTAAEETQAINFVNAAILAATSDMDYESSASVTEFIEKNYSAMDAFTGPMEPSDADDLVDLLRLLGVQVASLNDLGEAQLRAVIANGMYPVTRKNFGTALGEEVTLALDVIKAHSKHVYEHATRNLYDYLQVLAEAEKTIEEPSQFLDVLADIVGEQPQLLQAVIERASNHCEVRDLDELDQAGWHAVVSAGRFRTSTSNVSRYVVEHGVTPAMTQVLVDHDLVDSDDVDEEARFALAYALIDTDSLDAGTRVRLVGQMMLDHLDPEEFGAEGLSLIPNLLAAKLVPDDADTYAYIAAHPYSFREDYFASSNVLATYVTDLSLSFDDLARMMKSRRVAHSAKRAIADDVNFVEGRLSQQAATAICQWAEKGNEISPAMLVVLSQAGAPAEHILGLLETHLPEIELAALDDILRGLGDDYEPLTRPGHHRPRVKKLPGTEELLGELKSRGRVSSFGDAVMLSGFRVNMRH